MNRRFPLLVSILAVLVVTAIAGSPPIARAMAGLVGRSHLVVRQGDIKMLSAECTPICSPTPAARLRLRNGSLAPDPYVVPAGKAFVVTDVFVSQDFGGQMNDAVTLGLGNLLGGAFTHRLQLMQVLPNQRGSQGAHFALTGGVAYDAGSTPGFDLGTGFFTTRITVLGYETEL